MRFSGRNVFINNPAIKENVPKIMQSKFYLKLSSTVLSDFPPYFTIVNCMMIVLTKINKNKGLFKKF